MKCLPIYQWLALLTVTYVLLLSTGTWVAQDTLPLRSTRLPDENSELVSIIYTVSPPLTAVVPADNDYRWLETKGIPTPTGGGFRAQGMMWQFRNTLENQHKLQEWLTQAFGTKQWHLSYVPTFKLTTMIGDRKFGLEHTRVTRPGRYEEGKVFHTQTFTTFLYGFNNRQNDFFGVGERINVSNQYLIYEGPAWPALLILCALPTFFLIVLRRPLSRMISSVLRRTPNAPSP